MITIRVPDSYEASDLEGHLEHTRSNLSRKDASTYLNGVFAGFLMCGSQIYYGSDSPSNETKNIPALTNYIFNGWDGKLVIKNK
jgi:hypothetical protein